VKRFVLININSRMLICDVFQEGIVVA